MHLSTKPSRAWIEKHLKDPYVQKAQVDGYRARSAYKLLELHQKDQLVKPGMRVVDLGAAPGSWSQVVAQVLQGRGKIIAIDILPMDPLPFVDFIQGDFREPEVLAQLEAKLEGNPIDLLLSDMSPNLSGNPAIDQPRSMYLSELALAFAKDHLKPQGCFVIKTFQGQEFDAYLRELRASFKTVAIRKPQASRGGSREVYLVARGRKA